MSDLNICGRVINQDNDWVEIVSYESSSLTSDWTTFTISGQHDLDIGDECYLGGDIKQTTPLRKYRPYVVVDTTSSTITLDVALEVTNATYRPRKARLRKLTYDYPQLAPNPQIITYRSHETRYKPYRFVSWFADEPENLQISPCGRAVDVMRDRDCYRTAMRFWHDAPEQTATVTWYIIQDQDTCEAVPYEHPFASRNWEKDLPPVWLGETGERTWYSGIPPVEFTSDSFCGDIDQWSYGPSVDDDLPDFTFITQGQCCCGVGHIVCEGGSAEGQVSFPPTPGGAACGGLYGVTRWASASLTGIATLDISVRLKSPMTATATLTTTNLIAVYPLQSALSGIATLTSIPNQDVTISATLAATATLTASVNSTFLSGGLTATATLDADLYSSAGGNSVKLKAGLQATATLTAIGGEPLFGGQRIPTELISIIYNPSSNIDVPPVLLWKFDGKDTWNPTNPIYPFLLQWYENGFRFWNGNQWFGVGMQFPFALWLLIGAVKLYWFGWHYWGTAGEATGGKYDILSVVNPYAILDTTSTMAATATVTSSNFVFLSASLDGSATQAATTTIYPSVFLSASLDGSATESASATVTSGGGGGSTVTYYLSSTTNTYSCYTAYNAYDMFTTSDLGSLVEYPSSSSLSEVVRWLIDVSGDSPTTGTHTISVDITGSTEGFTAAVDVHEVDSSTCSILNSSSQSPTWSTTGPHTVNLDLTWSTGDMLMLILYAEVPVTFDAIQIGTTSNSYDQPPW